MLLPTRTPITLFGAGMLLVMLIFSKALLDFIALLGLPSLFNPYGLTDIATQLLLLIASAWVWTLLHTPQVGLQCLTLAASAWPLTLLLDGVGTALLLHTEATPDVGIGYQIGLAVPLLQSLILLRALYASAPRPSPRIWLWAIALAGLLGLSRVYLPSETLWSAQAPEDPALAAYNQLDLETIWAEQPALLETQFTELAAPDSEQPDTYFLGFAAYPYQNVFRREAERAQALFAQQYGAAHRSLLLVNHLDTYAKLPLATVANLNFALTQLGSGLDVSDDVLVLYLSSHGMETGEVAVEFGTLPLNNLSPEALKAALDGAGIRWRIVVISACYSGAFAQMLADSHSLIITAARADRASFGCDDSTELTYFGQALLTALTQHDDFQAAFHQVTAEVKAREQRDFPGESASEPQFALGEALAQRLPALQARWRTLRAQQTAPEPADRRPATAHTAALVGKR